MIDRNHSGSPHVSDADMQSLENSLMNDETNEREGLDLTNAINLYSIEEGAQIFYITSEGYVSAPSYPSALHVIKFEDESTVPMPSSTQASEQRPPAFLHVSMNIYILYLYTPSFNINLSGARHFERWSVEGVTNQ